MRLEYGLLLCFLTLPLTAQSQEPAEEPEPTMSFEEYEPRSTLVVPEHIVTRARHPFIDVHSHQRGSTMTQEAAEELVRQMDGINLGVLVNLSGGSGEGSISENLVKAVANMKGRYPKRFVLFTNISFEGIDQPDYGERTARQIETDVANGAQGLKIYKNLGMFSKDASGDRISTDDPRLDPIWAKCGELGIPVLIHTGEPASFHEPHDRFNERWLELKQRPNRKRPPGDFPPWEQIIGEQHNLFRKHPGTNFINAHLGWMGNDLSRLGKLLDELPNVTTELGAVIAELGRQPRAARQFLIRYQDRVMMGKDSWNPEEFHVYFRVFETADEYFPYYRKRHAHWKMYGLDLPEGVLKKIYYKNALRVIPGIDGEMFPD